MRNDAAALDQQVGIAAVIAVGVGFIMAIAGAGAEQMPLVIAGGFTTATALGVLLTAGWIDPVTVVLLAAPLPALLSTADIRIAAAAPVTAIAAVCWFLQNAALLTRIQLGAIPVRTLCALGGILVLTSLTSDYRDTAIREVINLGVMLGFLLVAVHRFVQKPEQRYSAVKLLVCIAALCGTLALLEAVQIVPGKFPRWGTNFNRAALGFGQPNALGLFFVLTLPFAAGLLRSAKSNVQRWSTVAALCAIVGGLAATFSRGSWLSILGGTVILWIAGERRYFAKIWLTGIGVVLFIELVTGGAISDTARRTVTDWVLEQRAGLMMAGLLMFWEHPLVGVGPGGFAPNLARVATEVPQLYDYLPTPHNAFIQMAAESGIFGLLLFILLLIVALRLFIKRAREPGIDAAEKNLRLAVLWSFTGLVVTCMVVWPFSHGSGQVVMLVAAIGWAVPTGRTLT